TFEYIRGVQDQGFDYGDLKEMSQNSLTYSFLQGGRLSDDASCQKDLKRGKDAGEVCQTYLDDNAKAAAQWDLEKRFDAFEKNYN
ncbi:MAG: adenosine deaminase, partial [Sphingomonadales bacterium]|nr:adenosine deaminase [Sphingomonadales bacterium]